MALHSRAVLPAIAIAVVAVALLPGCAPTSATTAPPATAPATRGLPPGVVGDAPQDAGNDMDPPPDPADAASALSFATTTLRTYCRPDAAQWLDDLLPYLSQSAGAAFASVDPSRVQCTDVAGDAAVTAGDEVYRFVVRVTTDAGPYELLVARSSDAAPWATETIEQLP